MTTLGSLSKKEGDGNENFNLFNLESAGELSRE